MALTAIKIGVTPTGQNIWYGDAADRDSLGTDLTPLTQFVYDDGAKEEFIGGAWKPIQPGDTMNGDQFASGTLLDGNPVYPNNNSMAGCPVGAMVWVVPGIGDTVTVWESCDGGTTWEIWPNGAVTVPSKRRLDGRITNLKIQRTGGSSNQSTWGITR